LSAVALLAVTPSNAGLGDSWAALERELAVFDPGGRYLTRPIERKIPRLALNGTYVLSSDVLLSGSDNKGFRDRDYRLLQFQNLFELEVGYKFSEGLALSGIFHGLYDAVYSLEGGDGLYAPKVDERFRAYEDSKGPRALHLLPHAQARRSARQAADCLGQDGRAVHRCD
jgi:hypothetical protein